MSNKKQEETPMSRFAAALTAAAALCAFSATSHAQSVLKASHQFPGGKGDARDEMVQIVAREAKAANVGLDVQVYPGASLFKPHDQWNAIVTVPSSEVYNALQTGVAVATDTSTCSVVPFRIYEQVKCISAPGDNALWFMYEPTLMSKRSFGRLNKQQQDALLAAGKKAEDYFNKATKGLDDEMVATFKKNNVEVATMTPAEYDAWVK